MILAQSDPLLQDPPSLLCVCMCVWPLSPQNEHLNKCYYYELTIAHKLSSGVTTPMGEEDHLNCVQLRSQLLNIFYGEACFDRFII